MASRNRLSCDVLMCLGCMNLCNPTPNLCKIIINYAKLQSKHQYSIYNYSLEHIIFMDNFLFKIMNKQDSKGLNVSHIKKYKDKIKALEKLIIVMDKLPKSDWTNNLFFTILGVSLTWLWLLVFSLFF